MLRQHRRALVMVEVLVAAGHAFVIAALVLQVVGDSRERARTRECASNMRNLATALISYENKKGYFPGYLNTLRRTDGTIFTTPEVAGQQQGVSWAIMIFPNLERGSSLQVLRSTAAPGGNAPTAADVLVPIDQFLCPSHGRKRAGGTFLDYVVNGGCQDTQTVTTTMPRDWVDNGVFFDRYSDDKGWNKSAVAPLVQMSLAYISGKDGITQTLLLSENVDGGRYDDYVEELLTFTWDPAITPDVSTSPPTVAPSRDERRINHKTGGRAVAKKEDKEFKAPAGGVNEPTTLAYYARPSSRHGDAVNVAYCDGRTQFLSEDIEYYVYGMLMSSNGKGVKVPGNSVVIANWNMPLDEAELCICPDDKENKAQGEEGSSAPQRPTDD